MKKLYFPSFLKFEAIKANHTPEILINDPRTGNAVRSDFRTVLLNYLSDISGEPATDAVGYFEVTLAELQTLESTSAVQQGYFYYITDRDILLQGVGVDKVSLHGAYYVKVGVGINEVDYVEFDVTNDIILRRRDKRGNDVALSKEYLDSASLPYTTIDEFYWLNDKVYGNTIVDSYVSLDDGVNQYGGTFNNNTITGRSVVDIAIVSGATAIFTANLINASQVNVYYNVTTYQFYNNNVLSGSVIEDNSTFSSKIYDNTFTNYTQFYNNSNYAKLDISFNTFSNFSTITIATGGGTVTQRDVFILRTTVSDSSGISINTSNTSANQIGYSTVTSGSSISLTNTMGAMSYLNISNNSSFSVTNQSTWNGQFLYITVDDRSSLNFSTMSHSASITDISVKESSAVSISSGVTSLNNWFVSENASVTLTNNTTNKTNIVIKRWTVTLYGGAATTTAINFTLDISMDSSFSPVYRSSLVQFHTFATRVAAGVFSFSATSHDAYTGVFFMAASGGGTISSFANTTLIQDQVAIAFQADIANTMIFTQDAAPVAVGGIGMNVASITLNGQDGQVTADTLTLQKSPNERFVVMSHFYTT